MPKNPKASPKVEIPQTREEAVEIIKNLNTEVQIKAPSNPISIKHIADIIIKHFEKQNPEKSPNDLMIEIARDRNHKKLEEALTVKLGEKHPISKDSYPEIFDALIKSLKNKSMDINYYNGYYTSLQLAAMHLSLEFIKIFIENGAKIELTSCNNRTVAEIANNNKNNPKVKVYLEIETAIQSKTNLDELRENETTSFLHEAARYNMEIEINRLIEAGANPDIKSGNGSTPLHRAASYEAVDALLKQGANANKINEDGDLPLHRALKQDLEPKAIKILIEKTNDLTKENKTNETITSLILKRYKPKDQKKLLEFTLQKSQKEIQSLQKENQRLKEKIETPSLIAEKNQSKFNSTINNANTFVFHNDNSNNSTDKVIDKEAQPS